MTKPWTLIWRRGNEKISFRDAKTHFVQGQVGSGKSILTEHIGMKYLENGAVILDLFASADGENLAWLRAPFIGDLKVCLLKGENVDVETVYDVKQVENLGLHDLEKYDLIINSRPLYLDKNHEYFAVGQLTDLLYRRFTYRRLIYLLAREASSLWYSRLKVSESQADAKSEMLYLLREMRHLGVALGLDTLRYIGIDKDLRSHVDYLYLKAQGVAGLSDDLKFLYHFFDPSFIRKMKAREFMLMCRTGGLAVGHFPYHEWHKRERENIIKAVGLKIEYGQVTELPKGRGVYKTVGDREHAEIIELYAGEGLGMLQIAEQQKRSTRTVSVHVKKHNEVVTRSGFCAACKRAGSQHFNKKATRGK